MFWKRVSFVLPTLLGLPLAVFAQPATQEPILTTIDALYQLICVASNWLFSFIMVVAIIILLVGAIKFFTAGGSEDTVATARKYLTYALVGVAVAILARSLVLVVANFVGSSGSASLFDC